MKSFALVAIALGVISVTSIVLFFRASDDLSSDEPYNPLEPYYADRSRIVTGVELKERFFLAKLSPRIDRIQITEVNPIHDPSRQNILFEINGIRPWPVPCGWSGFPSCISTVFPSKESGGHRDPPLRGGNRSRRA